MAKKSRVNFTRESYKAVYGQEAYEKKYESYSYYKKHYRATLARREKMAEKEGNPFADVGTRMLTKNEYDMARAEGKSEKDIVWEQFHDFNRGISERLTNMFRNYNNGELMRDTNGNRITTQQLLYNAGNKNLTQEQWDLIDALYHDNGTLEAQLGISFNDIWGS